MARVAARFALGALLAFAFALGCGDDDAPEEQDDAGMRDAAVERDGGNVAGRGDAATGGRGGNGGAGVDSGAMDDAGRTRHDAGMPMEWPRCLTRRRPCLRAAGRHAAAAVRG